jgi:hypothetical protein
VPVTDSSAHLADCVYREVNPEQPERCGGRCAMRA